MFCPQCGAEYREGVTTCADCAVALVERAPEKVDEPEWQDLVTVLRTSDEAELAVVRSLLEAEGIRCLLRGEGVQEVVGFGRVGGENLALGLVDVQVPAEQADAARELLAARDVAIVEPEEEGPAPS